MIEYPVLLWLPATRRGVSFFFVDLTKLKQFQENCSSSYKLSVFTMIVNEFTNLLLFKL